MISYIGRVVLIDIRQMLALLAIVPVLAFAQEKAVIHVGPFDVEPLLNVDVEKDDNIFNGVKGSEVSSTLTLVKPSLSAVADDGVKTYTINYELENGSYSDVDDNDYTDHSLAAKMDWRVDIRHLIELGAALNSGHQGRSTDSVANSAQDLNEFTNKDLAVKYTFGSEGAKGRIVVAYDKSSLRYDTNIAATSVLESDTDTKSVDFFLAFSPSSRVVFQVIDSENVFRNNSVANRKGRSYLLGATWDFTGTTKGDIRFGRSKNDLINAVGDTSASTWKASVEWSPEAYSVWGFEANKRAQTSENNIGSFVDVNELMVSWKHNWNDRLGLQLMFKNQKNDYIGTTRKDDSDSFELQFLYALRRWVQLGVGFGVENRDSTLLSNKYDKHTMNFSIKASL
jgi:polysaccharide biosynthesis protein VpsM